MADKTHRLDSKIANISLKSKTMCKVTKLNKK